ncbi:MAG: hypothetical protein WCI36_04280 [bacterium]
MKKVFFRTAFALVAVSAVVGALAFSHAVASGRENVIFQDYGIMKACAAVAVSFFLTIVFPIWFAAIRRRLKL